jgi:hypothetical protein
MRDLRTRCRRAWRVGHLLFGLRFEHLFGLRFEHLFGLRCPQWLLWAGCRDRLDDHGSESDRGRGCTTLSRGGDRHETKRGRRAKLADTRPTISPRMAVRADSRCVCKSRHQIPFFSNIAPLRSPQWISRLLVEPPVLVYRTFVR